MNKVFLILLFLFCVYRGFSQGSSPIILDQADKAIQVKTPRGEVQYLSGNVRFRQDSLLLFADSAEFYKNTVILLGEIVFLDGDSLSLHTDSLFYDGNIQYAWAEGNVDLIYGKRQLKTPRLEYDVKNKVAVYNHGAVITDQEAHLRSLKGRYDTRAEEIRLRDSVQIVHPKFYLRTDSLNYYTVEDSAAFLGPTYILQDNGDEVYTTRGYFLVDENKAVLRGKPQFKGADGANATGEEIIYHGKGNGNIKILRNARYADEDMKTRSDTLIYDQNTGWVEMQGNLTIVHNERYMRGERLRYHPETEDLFTYGRSIITEGSQTVEADRISTIQSGRVIKGDVRLTDTASGIVLHIDSAIQNKKRTEFITHGRRPWMMYEMDGDTLHMSSDTMKMVEVDTGGLTVLHAYYNVELFSSRYKGTADSAIYREKDSIMILTGKPILWLDTTQFSADTIFIYLADGKISKVDLIKEAFVITTSNFLTFNQLKGRYIIAWFDSSRVSRAEVHGNTETIYYIRDEQQGFVGPNEISASSATIYFEDNEVVRVKYNREITGHMTPIQRAGAMNKRLSDFAWLWGQKPDSISDVVEEYWVERWLK